MIKKIEQQQSEMEIWQEEAKKLIAEDKFVCLVKDGEEFYFDSRELDKNLSNFFELRRNGWKIKETIALPAYPPVRQGIIKNMGFIPKNWGYKRKHKT